MNEKQLRAELDAVYRSTSWKITAPLRLLSAFVHRYLIQPISPRRWAAALVNFMLRQTVLVIWVKRFLFRFPRLQAWAKRLYHRMYQGQVVHYVPSSVPSAAQNAEANDSPDEAPRLSRASQLLYQELKRAVKQGA